MGFIIKKKLKSITCMIYHTVGSNKLRGHSEHCPNFLICAFAESKAFCLLGSNTFSFLPFQSDFSSFVMVTISYSVFPPFVSMESPFRFY